MSLAHLKMFFDRLQSFDDDKIKATHLTIKQEKSDQIIHSLLWADDDIAKRYTLLNPINTTRPKEIWGLLLKSKEKSASRKRRWLKIYKMANLCGCYVFACGVQYQIRISRSHNNLCRCGQASFVLTVITFLLLTALYTKS